MTDPKRQRMDGDDDDDDDDDDIVPRPRTDADRTIHHAKFYQYQTLVVGRELFGAPEPPYECGCRFHWHYSSWAPEFRCWHVAQNEEDTLTGDDADHENNRCRHRRLRRMPRMWSREMLRLISLYMKTDVYYEPVGPYDHQILQGKMAEMFGAADAEVLLTLDPKEAVLAGGLCVALATEKDAGKVGDADVFVMDGNVAALERMVHRLTEGKTGRDNSFSWRFTSNSILTISHKRWRVPIQLVLTPMKTVGALLWNFHMDYTQVALVRGAFVRTPLAREAHHTKRVRYIADIEWSWPSLQRKIDKAAVKGFELSAAYVRSGDLPLKYRRVTYEHNKLTSYDQPIRRNAVTTFHRDENGYLETTGTAYSLLDDVTTRDVWTPCSMNAYSRLLYTDDITYEGQSNGEAPVLLHKFARLGHFDTADERALDVRDNFMDRISNVTREPPPNARWYQYAFSPWELAPKPMVEDGDGVGDFVDIVTAFGENVVDKARRWYYGDATFTWGGKESSKK